MNLSYGQIIGVIGVAIGVYLVVKATIKKEPPSENQDQNTDWWEADND